MVQILIAVVVIGLVVWLVNNYIPMDPMFKKIFNVLVVIFLIIWLLRVSGIFTF